MENKALYIFLDYFFIVFHSAWTIFNLLGWLWQRTRKLHLVTTLLTAISWFVLGYFYGWGYCLCTDWHWHVREHLGKLPKSNSFIDFVIVETSGFSIPPDVMDIAILIIFIFLLAMSISLNIKDSCIKKY